MLEATSEGTRENSNGPTANKPHGILHVNKRGYFELKTGNIFPVASHTF